MIVGHGTLGDRHDAKGTDPAAVGKIIFIAAGAADGGVVERHVAAKNTATSGTLACSTVVADRGVGERYVAKGINSIRRDDNAFVIVTHYQRLLNYIVPDRVHVLFEGRIAASGDKQLALRLEEEGYDWLRDEKQEPVTA